MYFDEETEAGGRVAQLESFQKEQHASSKGMKGMSHLEVSEVDKKEDSVMKHITTLLMLFMPLVIKIISEFNHIKQHSFCWMISE
jgi:hypothetical protein